ncbi:MAG TPA: hypothetical protein VF479_00895 [Pseudolysinimonas sp.]
MADRARWREPSSRLALRWGSWSGRSWGGLALIVGGGVAIAGTTASTIWLATAGVAAHVLGWAVMPAAGWRRLVVVLPSTLAMANLLSGPTYLTVLVVPFLAWLLVRHRPLRVWPMAVFVIAAGIVLARVFPDYSGMLPALGVAAGILIGAAWAARAVHAASARRPVRRRPVRQGRQRPRPQLPGPRP